MAQYGHNFYGSSYYGKTNAFSGSYTTRIIETEEPLKSTFTVNINAVMPHAFYDPRDPEFEQVSGTWTYDEAFEKLVTSSAGAEIVFTGTADTIGIRYEQRSTGASNVNVEITTAQPDGTDTVSTYSFSSKSDTINTNAEFLIEDLPFAMHTVRIFLDATHPTTEYFNFKGINSRVTDFTVETKSRAADGTWTAWQAIALSGSLLNAASETYLISGTTPNYQGATGIQVRVWLATSDNALSPELLDLATVAGDSSNRAESGRWEGIFDMSAVAEAMGKTFAQVETIDWTATEPDGTTLTIRSSSSPTKALFGPRSVPYKKNVNRLRLKEGKTSGWMDAPFVRPFYSNEHTTTVEWRSWRDQSFLPPNTSRATIHYYFLDAKRNESEAYHSEMNPTAANRGMLSPIGKSDFLLRVKLGRENTMTASPVVDYIDFDSLMEYNEAQAVQDATLSAVDNENTGKKQVFSLSSLQWGNPTEVANPEYRLEDNTKRPQDVMLYYNSEMDKGTERRPVTKLSTDIVWAETKDRVPKHFQYGGGAVKYPNTDEIEMAPSFTPSLKGIPYRYFLLKGWPTEYHTTQRGDTMLSVSQDYGITIEALAAENASPQENNDGTLLEGQRLKLPNSSDNPSVRINWKSNQGMLTDKSSHNALMNKAVDLSSDAVEAKVSQQSTMGEVDWTSEEKIYTGVLNLNDVQSEYRRIHTAVESSQSFEIDYTAVAEDTYTSVSNRFAVYETDLRKRNEAGDSELVAGQRIVIPAKFSLPAIDPKAIVSANPYRIDIVYNSVKRKDGSRIEEERIFQVGDFQIEYRTEAKSATVTRGPVTNGKDPLQHARVVSIDRVYDASGFDWTPGTQLPGGGWSGDYVQDGNYVKWDVEGSLYEPVGGEKYFVDYTVEVANKVTVIMDTDYVEEGGIDRIWRSPEVKEFTGMCYPGKDMRVELPAISEWVGTGDIQVEDIEYLIEDNDLWVKTWIEYNENTGTYFAVGSLQDRVPKDNWLPTIQTGYYYLSDEEYYLFNEPVVVEPTDREMPIARNITYVPGKYDNAARLQEGSANLVRNSGFDTANETRTVYKLTF